MSTTIPWLRPLLLRRLSQLAILGLLVWLALGHGRRSFEAFCPFGGVEAAWGLFRERAYTCTTSEMNLAMLLAVLGLALVAGKSFCAWICPIGLIHEYLAKLGRSIPFLRRRQVPLSVDRWLRLLRYPFSLIMVVLTWRAGELLLRGYDPFYILFSGFGHGTLGLVSWISITVLLLGGLIVPMLWCRCLCPLGVVQDLLARFGLLRLHRAPAACTGCGACDAACLQRLSVSTPPSIGAVDCTRCLDCLEACPTGALSLKLGPPIPGARRKWTMPASKWVLPVPVAAALILGLRVSEPLTLPTAEATFYDRSELTEPLTVAYTVEGVKCRGTSNFFLRRASSFAGVGEIRAYAGLHRAVITFDRSKISPEALRDSIDAPIRHPKTGEWIQVFHCTEMVVD